MRSIRRELKRYWPEALFVVLVLGLILVLLIAGLLWLAEQHWLEEWFIASLVLAAALFGVRRLRAVPGHDDLTVEPGSAESVADQRARDRINAMVGAVTAKDIASLDSVQKLVALVVEEVARAYEPEDEHAMLRFTLPELLLMLEDVSQRLRTVIVRELPVLVHLDMRLALSTQRVLGTYQAASSVLRVLRLANPVSAIVGEVRGYLVGKTFSALGSAIKARLAATIAREIGLVTMRLYSGGYRRSATELKDEVSPALRVERAPGPLRILVAGQQQSGKSSLVNALVGRDVVLTGRGATEEFIAIDVADTELGPLRIVDTPGLGSEPGADWLDEVTRADLVIWVAAGNRADRASDGRALSALRDLSREHHRVRPVPVVLAVTHADRLTPPMEWRPPYDLANGDRIKERNMRAARNAACDALEVPAERSAIVALDPHEAAWNLEDLWGAIELALPAARQKRLEKALEKGPWHETVKNTIRSVPGAVKRGIRILRH